MIENRSEIIQQCIQPFVQTKTQGPPIHNPYWHIGITPDTPVELVNAKLLGKWVSTSYGMHESGYDVRLREDVVLIAGRMVLGTTLEHLHVPKNARVKCEDKSTNLRLGIRLAGKAEPGWHGYLTLELMYIPLEGGPSTLLIPKGWGIACYEFGLLMTEGDYGPHGKYQGATEAETAK